MIGAYSFNMDNSISFGVKLEKGRFDNLNIIFMYVKAEKVAFGPNLT